MIVTVVTAPLGRAVGDTEVIAGVAVATAKVTPLLVPPAVVTRIVLLPVVIV